MLCVAKPSSATSKRLYRIAKEEGRLLNFTNGNVAMAYIILENGVVITSAKRPIDISRAKEEMDIINIA